MTTPAIQLGTRPDGSPITAPTHPLAVTGSGHDLLNPSTWYAYNFSVRDLQADSFLVSALSGVEPLAEALAAYDAAIADGHAAVDEGADAASAYQESVAAWHAAATSGASKPPKVDTDAAAFTVASLYKRAQSAFASANRHARAVDKAVPVAAASPEAVAIRDAVAASLVERHKAAHDALVAADAATSSLLSGVSALRKLDAARLVGTGLSPSDAATVVIDHFRDNVGNRFGLGADTPSMVLNRVRDVLPSADLVDRVTAAPAKAPVAAPPRKPTPIHTIGY